MSLLTGPLQVSSVAGLVSGPNDVAGLAASVARICSGWAITKVPLSRWPVAVALGSVAVNVALAIVLVIVAGTSAV